MNLRRIYIRVQFIVPWRRKVLQIWSSCSLKLRWNRNSYLTTLNNFTHMLTSKIFVNSENKLDSETQWSGTKQANMSVENKGDLQSTGNLLPQCRALFTDPFQCIQIKIKTKDIELVACAVPCRARHEKDWIYIVYTYTLLYIELFLFLSPAKTLFSIFSCKITLGLSYFFKWEKQSAGAIRILMACVRIGKVCTLH